MDDSKYANYTDATDSPIWEHLTKRGMVNVNSDASPVNLYYEIYGNGAQKVAFSNGMGSDRQMWEFAVKSLLDIGGYQCLVYDNRGTGYSDSAESQINITSSLLASDLKTLLETLKWEKTNIVGVSMGGMVVLEFACTYPGLVNTITLCVTHAGLTFPPLKGIVDTLRANFASDPMKRFEILCGTLYPQDYLDSPAPKGSGCKNMLDYCVKVGIRRAKYTKSPSFSTFVGQAGVTFRHYISPARLEALGHSLPNKQILIITGDHDHLVRTSNSYYLADKIGRDHVRFETRQNAGHGVFAQYSKSISQSLDKMIKETSTS